MKLSDFDFHLPEELIATRPAKPRSSARLLLAEGEAIRDLVVTDLAQIFRPGDRLVLNNTRVIPARLAGQRHRMTGQGAVTAKVEITLLEPRADGGWRALAKPLRKVEPGEEIVFSDRLSATVVAKTETDLDLRFNLAGDGALPLREIARRLGKPVLELPAGLLRAALAVGSALGLSRYGPEQLDFLRYRPVLLNAALKEVLGYVPGKTSAEAFEAFVAARARQGRPVAAAAAVAA